MDDPRHAFSALHIDGEPCARCRLPSPGAGAADGPRYGSFHVVVAGACWLRGSAGGEPARLGEGDLVIVPRGDAFAILSAPAGDAQSPGHRRDPVPGGRCRFLAQSGVEFAQLVCGCFRVQRDDPLAAMLPRFVHIPAREAQGIDALRSTMALLGEEAARPGIASETVLQHLMELLLIHAFRAVAAPAGGSMDLLVGLRDHKQLGQVLRAMRAHPEYPWTIDELSRRAACSRTAFLARFTSLTGQPPLRYLTSLRMARAKELLLAGTSGLDLVSEAVGYGSVEGFTRAFKRSFGVTPAEVRGRKRDVKRLRRRAA